jgi:protein-S-isoprenylcysteine O-methyltransferase Ste14
MPIWLVVVLLAAYVSLLVELTILRVPSVASSLNIWRSNEALVAAYSARYRWPFRLSRPWKVVLFLLPLLIVYAVYLYPVVAIAIGPDFLHDYLFTPAPLLDAGGIVLVVAGRLLAIATALQLGRHGLHTTGVFRLSRNPGLVGMYAFCGGVWLTMPSASLLVGILVYVAYMDLKVRMEEDYLQNTLGDPYIAYQLRTGRYIA